ncbi:MAG TPA: acetate--CoA ligase family protein [Stellaceae bacterium]|nr:acetate--CoA ligase family protein [Stellaceae bacterium]
MTDRERIAAARAVIAAARAAGRPALEEPEAKYLLALWGIAVPKGVRIDAAEPVESHLAGLDPPFAVKVIAPGILHKSDVGGVALALSDHAAVAAMRRAMLSSPALAGRPVAGFLVEEMAPRGHELAVGGFCDPRFGPVLMLGLGGIFVEVLSDVAFRLCPLTPGDARAMLGALRGRALLSGARGGIVADEKAILDVLLRLGGSDGLFPALADEIAEIDVNPLIASERGAVAADARIVLRERVADTLTHPALRAGSPLSRTAGEGAEPRRKPGEAGEGQEVLDRFAPLFFPQSIAVLGASAGGGAPANAVIRHIRGFGFAGPIYPVHPSAAAIEGLPAWPSLGALPQPVDYAFVAIAAAQVPAALRAAQGRVRFAQIMSSGFGEAEDGAAREAELVAAARAGGVRVIGPNCLGTHSPRGHLTFIAGMAQQEGAVGILSQSGGLAMDVMRRGQRRGLGFSGVVTIGNCADVTASELLEFLLADPETRVVGLYLEDAADGRRLFELMRDAEKPIVLLRGGRTGDGQRAALSHTGALASDERIWTALARQTGAALVDTLDEWIGALLAFQLLVPNRARPTGRVVLFGNGGGASVLAADAFARRGFAVAGFGAATRAALERLALPAGASVRNPIDVPANVLRRDEAAVARRILAAILDAGEADAVVMHLNMPVILSYRDSDMLGALIAAALAAGAGEAGRAHLILVLRSDGEPEIEAQKQECRRRALAAGIPVYDEIAEAAAALAALAQFERRRETEFE